MEKAQRLLDNNRTALLRIAGVCGFALGYRDPHDLNSEIVVQVFVNTAAEIQKVEKAISPILGRNKFVVLPIGSMKLMQKAVH